MGCNCGKKKVAKQPKKTVKTATPSKTGLTSTKRIIRRTAR